MRFSLALLMATIANFALATNSSAPFVYPDNQKVPNPGYMVVVKTSFSGLCSGFFVAPDRVLTAAHCTSASSISYGGSGPRFSKSIKVVKMIADKSQDIAVLYLAKRASSIRLLPISLNPQCPTGNLTIYGFGVSSQAGTGIGTLRSFVATVDGCSDGLVDIQGKEGSGGCVGDSGSPFVNDNEQAVAILRGGIGGSCSRYIHGPMLSNASKMLRQYCAHCAGVA